MGGPQSARGSPAPDRLLGSGPARQCSHYVGDVVAGRPLDPLGGAAVVVALTGRHRSEHRIARGERRASEIAAIEQLAAQVTEACRLVVIVLINALGAFATPDQQRLGCRVAQMRVGQTLRRRVGSGPCDAVVAE